MFCRKGIFANCVSQVSILLRLFLNLQGSDCLWSGNNMYNARYQELRIPQLIYITNLQY